MGDLGNTKQSLVAMFDELLIQQEEAREEVTKPGPEYLLKVMEVSALAKARDSEQWRELQDQKLRLEREVERLQSRVSVCFCIAWFLYSAFLLYLNLSSLHTTLFLLYFLAKLERMSIGSGNTIVEFFSAAIAFSV